MLGNRPDLRSRFVFIAEEVPPIEGDLFDLPDLLLTEPFEDLVSKPQHLGRTQARPGLDDQPDSDCSRDACVASIRHDRAEWRLLATRSAYRIDWVDIIGACASADIVVSDRRLPSGCRPRWLRLDSEALERTGGLAIYLGKRPWVDSVAGRVGGHPWAQAVGSSRSAPLAFHRRSNLVRASVRQ